MRLKISNKKFDFFSSFGLNLRYDSVGSTFFFDLFFDPDNPEHKAAFRPSLFPSATVEHNGETLITGVILSNTFLDSAKKSLTAVGGYSKSGVLEDCNIPLSLYPLQFDNLSLREIAEKVIKPFGIGMVIDPAVSSRMEKTYDTSTASTTQTVKSYLTELAAQRNIIISHNEKGQIVFTEANTKKPPILDFEAGIPNTEMTLSFSGQPMHSTITAQKQASIDGGNAGEAEASNPFVEAFRPKVVTQTSGDDNDTGQAAKNILQSELKNIKLTIKTDRWEIEGSVIKPNSLITVVNPDVYLFKKTTWFIESVNLQGNEKQNVATINCVLPSVYDGGTPKNIF